MKLVLGVVDIPYLERVEPSKQVNARLRKHRKAKKVKFLVSSTGEVAEILEAKYGVMQAFFNKHQNDIARSLEQSIANQLENVLVGGPIPSNPMVDATGQIETMFRHFISNREIEGMGIVGVPTEAALKGVNHRFKHPYAKSNQRRPSFRDTGLYEAAFAAEIKQ